MASKPYIELSWTEVLANLKQNPSILLGNGLSIACDPSFVYNNLLELAVTKGLPDEVIELFRHLDTANFEQVMQILDESGYISELYGCVCPSLGRIREDVERTKQALIDAVTVVHGRYPNQKALEEVRKLACVEFLRPFHLVYTLNYDFLLYWVWQRGLDERAWGTGDGFVSKEGFFTGLQKGGIRFLHGALHIYVERGSTKKHHFGRQGHEALLDQVRDGLDNQKYPLFIAEGSDAKKRVGIGRNDYLSACFREFSEIGPDLVVYGSSLGPSDAHLVESVINNRKLKRLYVGSLGEPTIELEATMRKIALGRRAKRIDLELLAMYRADEVMPWDKRAAVE